MYESVGVEAPILLSYTHKNEWNTHGGLPTRCQRSAMGVSLIFVGVRQQNGCFDTHTFIQFSTYVQHHHTPALHRYGTFSRSSPFLKMPDSARFSASLRF